MDGVVRTNAHKVADQHTLLEREASCSCGQLRAVVAGEPIRVSVCHCLECQRRTGSAFGVQARYARAQVTVSGASREYVRLSDDESELRHFHFCGDCGSTVFYTYGTAPDPIVIPVGAFADPGFPVPTRTVYEDRAHPWVSVEIDG